MLLLLFIPAFAYCIKQKESQTKRSSGRAAAGFAGVITRGRVHRGRISLCTAIDNAFVAFLQENSKRELAEKVRSVQYTQIRLSVKELVPFVGPIDLEQRSLSSDGVRPRNFERLIGQRMSVLGQLHTLQTPRFE